MPFCLKENVPFFRKNFFKFYDILMGYNFHNVLKQKFDDFKKLMTEEQYNSFIEKVMANKYSLMDIDINIMIPSFDQYKENIDLYYE